MDAFRTARETGFRSAVRDFLEKEGRIAPPLSAAAVSERVALVEETACRDPKLGRELAHRREDSGPADRTVEEVLGYALLAGTAAHVLESGAIIARARGAFASSLMGCREVQESLAGLASGAELLRLGTCRLCRLVERGDRGRAAAESTRLLDRARALSGSVRSVALSLLGPAWVAENLPGEDVPWGKERTSR